MLEVNSDIQLFQINHQAEKKCIAIFLRKFFSSTFVFSGSKNLFTKEGVLLLVEVWPLTLSEAIKFILESGLAWY